MSYKSKHTRYKIVRLYAKENHPDHMKVIRRGLTLFEAQKHCSDPKTNKLGVWFDGYSEQ